VISIVPRLYTFVGVFILGCGLGGAAAWQVQQWRWKANTAADKAMQSAVAEQQKDANLDRSRAAENSYEQREPVRTKIIIKTLKELKNAPIPSCLIGTVSIGLLNNAASSVKD
jgi:hypothetical protein